MLIFFTGRFRRGSSTVRPKTHPGGSTEDELACFSLLHSSFWDDNLVELPCSLCHHFKEMLRFLLLQRAPESWLTIFSGGVFLLESKAGVIADVRMACDCGPVRRKRSKSNRRETTFISQCSIPFNSWILSPLGWSELTLELILAAPGNLESVSTTQLPTYEQASVMESNTELKLAGWDQIHSWEMSQCPSKVFSLTVPSSISNCDVSTLASVSELFLCLQRKETGPIAPWGYWSNLYSTAFPWRVPFK